MSRTKSPAATGVAQRPMTVVRPHPKRMGMLPAVFAVWVRWRNESQVKLGARTAAAQRYRHEKHPGYHQRHARGMDRTTPLFKLVRVGNPAVRDTGVLSVTRVLASLDCKRMLIEARQYPRPSRLILAVPEVSNDEKVPRVIHSSASAGWCWRFSRLSPL